MAFESFKKHARLFAMGATLSATPACEVEKNCEPKESATMVETDISTVPEHAYYDANPAFHAHIENGEFSEDEKKARTEILQNGEVVFRDIGVTFYKVRPGDTLSGIRQKLSKYEEFSYLDAQSPKLQSFNIPEKALQAGMWLPIPLENEKRIMTEEQFKHYAEQGIEELRHHEKYGKDVEKILQKISLEELLISLMAIAKQESGGAPIGNFVYQRYEPHRKTFSYSMFHIMNEGVGLHARKRLHMSIGQTYHPKNAVQLALVFMIEKARNFDKTADSYFPLDKEIERFAVMYNGGHWQKTNPDYAKHITHYLQEARNKDGLRIAKNP